MNRRILDLLLSAGGLALAVLLGVLGLILQNQGNFAQGYVRDQLAAQKITFTPSDKLNGENKEGPCLDEYAGTPLDSGKKAECYANNYIAFHMKGAAKGAGQEGATYATLGTPQREATAALQAAKDAGEPTEELQKKLDGLNGLRETMFKGEMLRGALLTSYGFSIFGARALTAATVCFLAAAVLLVLALAGFAHGAKAAKAASGAAAA